MILFQFTDVVYSNSIKYGDFELKRKGYRCVESTEHDLSYFSEALVGFGVLCNMKTGKVIKTFSYYKDEYLHVL